ncbi:hypothetical protein HK12_10065 [Acetobacter orientalis]|uniref:Uncharacterized protein n=1 Tax=Acetobacter orientalis TaxID=146474 RepID=A0A251ZZD0_9PROT|nr:hypothetical protein HK12_10065 [Acetobacter orientalis]
MRCGLARYLLALTGYFCSNHSAALLQTITFVGAKCSPLSLAVYSLASAPSLTTYTLHHKKTPQ